MSYVKSHIDDELTDLPLFSIPAYRDAPVRVLLIQDLDTETAFFRSTLETITGETFDPCDRNGCENRSVPHCFRTL